MRNSRRNFLGIFGAGLAMSGLAAHAQAAKKQPNIIMFVSDDHSAPFTGCYGDTVVQTPNIDRLAKEGMKFTRFFAASPTCGPSRTAICTGKMPPRVGCWRNHGKSFPDTRSMPHYLKELGYRVVIAGKTDVHPKEAYPFERMSSGGKKKKGSKGFDPTAFIQDHLQKNPDQPFCLLLNSKEPHTGWVESDKYNPADLVIPPNLVDTPKTREVLCNYYTEVSIVDDYVGQSMAAIEKLGIGDNTVMIYTSDQGIEWAPGKWNLYDLGLRVPFIVRWPGKTKPGSVTEELVSAVDIVPTFIDMAGGKPVEGLDGISFVPTLKDPEKHHRDYVYGTHTGNPPNKFNDSPMRSIRTKDHLYIFNLEPDKKWISHFTDDGDLEHRGVFDTWVEKAKTDPKTAAFIKNLHYRPQEELYDLKKDPYQLNNIAQNPENKKLVAEFHQHLVEWRKAQGDVGEPESASKQK